MYKEYQLISLDSAMPELRESARPSVQRLSPGIVLFHFGPGQSLNDHKAVVPICVQVISGSLEFGIKDGPTYTLTPGQLLELDKLRIHRVDNISDSPAQMILCMLVP